MLSIAAWLSLIYSVLWKHHHAILQRSVNGCRYGEEPASKLYANARVPNLIGPLSTYSMHMAMQGGAIFHNSVV